MSGTAAAQAVGFALTPIISRLYSPSEFGVLGSFDAVLTVIVAGATLDYDQAAMLPKAKQDAVNLFMLSCISTAIATVCCLAVCLIAPSFVQGLIKAPNAWMLALLVVAVLASGLGNSFQAWCVRTKAFKHTAASQVIRSLSSKGTQIGLSFVKGGSSALVGGAILGNILASSNLIRGVLPDLSAFGQSIRWRRIRQLAKDYRDFPIFSASKNVINALSQGLPVLLLARFYGIAVAGAYSFGVGILGVPMSFVLTALKQVLFQKACEAQNSGDRLLPLYTKITLGLFALGLVPSAVLFIWSPQLFSWVFGSQWHTAGEYSRSLIVWLMFVFCNTPAVLFARIIRIQRFAFFYELCLLAIRVMALALGGLYLDASRTIVLFSLVGAATNVILILIVGYAVMKKEGHAGVCSK